MPGPGSEGAGLPTQPEVPVDGRQRHAEHAHNLPPRHPPVDRRDHPQPEILGVSFHASRVAPSSTPRQGAVRLLRQTYPDHVLSTIIPRNVELKDASMNKQDIFAYSPQ